MTSGQPTPPRNHTRKTSKSKPKPGHERCQHSYKMMKLGMVPQPTAPWRPYVFRVHCLVSMRWMKIRVPFAWFWWGSDEYGTPEVEMGEIARQPQVGLEVMPDPSIIEEEKEEPAPPPTDIRSRLGRMESQMRNMSSSLDAHTRGSQ